MGCGSSGNVVPAHEGANGHHKVPNGQGHHDDDLPTVVLPDTPAQPKPPIAFEIPLEEFDSNRRMSTTPPPHLQRLLQPPQADISLPDIEEKLAEAEQRRQSILQQRAASAQKRAQKMMRSVHEMDRLDSEQEPMNIDSVKADPINVDRMKTASIKTDPMKMDSMKMDSMQTDSMQTDSMPMDSTQINSMKVDSTQMDSMQMGPGRLEADAIKHGANAVHMPPGPGVCEDKNIS